MHHRFWLLCGMLAFALGARRPAVAVPTSEPGTTRPSVEETIPQETLLKMDQAELGKLYRPELADRLYSAHQLLEQFFATTSAGERRSAQAGLEAMRLPPEVVGRISRIRMHWPGLQGGGVFYINQKIGPYNVRYFIGVPKNYDRTTSWPLVIKLPGVAAFLTDPPPDATRVVQIYTNWLQDELALHPDAIVLAPLLDLDELYGPSYNGMNSVIQPLLDAANRVNVDPRRVYLLGHSLGAHAVWNLALHYPTYFAAICPLAGGAGSEWQRVRLPNLKNVLPVVWHDDDDKVIPVKSSLELVKRLKAQKIDVDFLETKGVGHGPTDEIYEDEYRKMRGRVRELYPPQVWLASDRPDPIFNRVDWVQVYQQMQTGKEQRHVFRKGTGHMTTYEQSYTVRASLAANRIEVSTTNVALVRFYLNEQMVDFSKPVTVVVNRKVRFQGMLKPNVADLLKDQSFLGRGWRYYTAVIDCDLVGAPATGPTTRSGRITVGPSR